MLGFELKTIAGGKKIKKRGISLLLCLCLLLALLPVTAAAGDTPDFTVSDGNGLAGLSFDVAGVECIQNGTTFNIKVPNGNDEVEISFFTDEGNCFVGTGTKVTGIIQAKDITVVSSKKIVMTPQGVQDKIHGYKKSGLTYVCTIYELNFTYLNEVFRITQEVGEKRFVYDKDAAATELSVGAAAPDGETITYQWQKSTDGKTYTDVAGANSESFTPPTDAIGKTLYRVQVSNETKTYESGKVIVDVQDPGEPSRPWVLRELVIASEGSDDAETVYLSEQPWTTDDLEYVFTISDTEISKHISGSQWSTSFWIKAVTADSSYAPLRYYKLDPRYGTTSPTDWGNNTSGNWSNFHLTANGDPIAKIRIGPKAQENFGEPTDFLEYTIRARIRATLGSLTADDTMAPTFSPEITEYSAELPGDQKSITITAPALVTGNPVVINGETADENGSVVLPVQWTENKMTVTIKVGTDIFDEDTRTASSTYTLTLNKEEGEAKPQINVQPKDATYIDSEENPAPLYIRANASDTLSYQWFSSTVDANTGGEPIAGANSASFTPPIAPVNTREDTSTQQKVTYYYCMATNTANSETAISEPAAVTLIPDPTPYNVRIVEEDGSEVPAGGYTYNQDDTVTKLKVLYESRNTSATWTYRWNSSGMVGGVQQTQIFTPRADRQVSFLASCEITCDLDGVTYKTISENSVSVKVTAIKAMRPNIDPNKGPKWQTSNLYTGNLPTLLEVDARSIDGGTLSYQWYMGTSHLEEFSPVYGATESTYQPPTSNLPGTVYYYCRVTNTVQSYDGNVYSTTADSVKAWLTFAVFDRPFMTLTGNGTAAKPWLITNSEDLQTLQTQVETDKEAFQDCYFKFTNDITLPADWEPIGSTVFFGGSIDGNNKTLTVAADGLPLLGHVRHCTVKNLNIYGAKIAGYGLVQNYTVDYGVSGNYGEYANTDSTTINIENVTLKKGSSTLESGFIGGYASGINYVNINNCTIEEGVVIGYDRSKSNIGSFGGALNGTITNSVSYATVYGVDNVGGLIGIKGQSMGPCKVYNSEFHGALEATGTYAGGIIGSGYYGKGTAPNTPCVTIQDCLVAGTVKGGDYVGGILGGEPGCEQNWVNGIGQIQNNLFVGTIQSSGTNVGGVIGYLTSVNRFNIISNNFYAESSGAAKGIGRIKNVDTSSARFGRSDKPTGTDAEKLAKAASAAELTDGTILTALNSGVNSSGNWTVGTTHPERGTSTYLRNLSITGYASRYTTNDVVDFEGLSATLIYSDGSVETATGVVYTGYEQKTVGVQCITATYTKNAIDYVTLFEINIIKGSESSGGEENREITVFFTLLGDEKHDSDIDGKVHTLKRSNLDTWIEKESYTLSSESFVMDIFATALTKHGHSWYNAGIYKGTAGNYIQSITMPDGDLLGEFDNGPYSGWMYTRNGTHPLLGVNEQQLSNGDVIVFHYTDDYREEEGSEKWNESPNKESGGTILTPKVTATNGTAAASVSGSDMSAAIADAKKDGSGAIVIQPDITGQAPKTTVEVPKASLNSMASGTDADLMIVTPNGSVTIPNEALGSLTSQAGGDTITVVVESIEPKALTDEQQKLVGDNPVFDISILSGGKNISSFGGQALTISLPYTLKDGESADGVAIWYLSDDGKLERIVCKYDEKTGLATFTTNHLSLYVVGYDGWVNPFTDIRASDWFYEAVKYAVEEELFAGTSATAFSPNKPMTRAMLVTVLHRLDGKPSAAGANSFADVAAGQWYTDAVVWANANDIVSGYGNGKFGTNDPITREQMAAILYRYAQHKGYDVTKTSELAKFTDAASVSSWANGAIKWAVGSGLISGMTDTTLAPTGSATRAQVASILMRFASGISK